MITHISNKSIENGVRRSLSDSDILFLTGDFLNTCEPLSCSENLEHEEEVKTEKKDFAHSLNILIESMGIENLANTQISKIVSENQVSFIDNRIDNGDNLEPLQKVDTASSDKIIFQKERSDLSNSVHDKIEAFSETTRDTPQKDSSLACRQTTDQVHNDKTQNNISLENVLENKSANRLLDGDESKRSFNELKNIKTNDEVNPSINEQSQLISSDYTEKGICKIEIFTDGHRDNGTDNADVNARMRNSFERHEIIELKRQNVPLNMDCDRYDRENFAAPDRHSSFSSENDKEHTGKIDLTVTGGLKTDGNLNQYSDGTVKKINGENLTIKFVNELKPHILILKQNKCDELTVKIKPDENTELSIRMFVHDGKIFASACLEKGDFFLLKNHWIELQESLSRYGVDLGMLYMGTNDNRQTHYKTGEQTGELFRPINRNINKTHEPNNLLRNTNVSILAKAGWETWA